VAPVYSIMAAENVDSIDPSCPYAAIYNASAGRRDEDESQRTEDKSHRWLVVGMLPRRGVALSIGPKRFAESRRRAASGVDGLGPLSDQKNRQADAPVPHRQPTPRLLLHHRLRRFELIYWPGEDRNRPKVIARPCLEGSRSALGVPEQ
jgi:hypothetical protein